ncbi:MAG: hypothetical protein JST80_04390 [Bdellovibrionales bacterium]|nr:hypothetical protein [Bdellovibrionales bacterium]
MPFSKPLILAAVLLSTSVSSGAGADELTAADLIESNACPRLSDVTCTPGTLNDGTGVSWAGTDEQLKKVETNRLNELAIPFFKNKLKTDAAFRAEMASKMSPPPASEKVLLDFTVAQGVTAMSRKQLGLINAAADLAKKIGIGTGLFKKKYVEDRLFGDFFGYVSGQVVDQGLATQIASDFKTVRMELMAVIHDQIPAGNGRDRMINQVASVQFDGIDCSALGTFAMTSRWDNLLIPNAFYNPSSNRFTYCNGLGHYNSSLFQRYAVIAHELTHSVDPCAFERDGRKFPAPQIVSCLRDNESVGAKKQNKFDPPKLDPKIAALGEPLTDCGGGDQIGESFSDFMAAEVLSRMVLRMKPLTLEQKRTGFANAMRFPGECKESSEYDVHPQLRARIDRIFLANPAIQGEMQCTFAPKAPKPPRYCGKR